MESSCSEFRSSGKSFLILAARDVSARERRRIVRDTNTRYRAIVDAAAIGIVQCTMDGQVVESNPAVERMLGYTHEELRGMHFREFTFPDDVSADVTLFEEMVAGKRDYYQIELRFLRKDKTYGWNNLTVSLVRGPNGEPEFAIGMAEDITERKSAEAQLRQAQKMEVLGRLVGGVSHDFNNLLTAITLYADLIGSGLPAKSRLRRHVHEIRLAGEHGAALIQQLLGMVRQQPVEPRVVDLNDLITGMHDLLARLIGEHISLKTVLATDLPQVFADPTQLRQLILNLVLNSRDAIGRGGHIKITTARLGDDAPVLRPCVELSVSDDGCGMDEETRSHLFEPFFTTKGEGRGNGLGLTTVQKIVHQLGGVVEVITKPGQGTTVHIILPYVAEKGTSQPEAGEPASGKTGTATILLVEDDGQVRRSAHRVLRACGYKVLTARSGTQALQLSSEYEGKIDLVITDLVMPGMNGREVVKQLRQARPEIKAIGVSGYEQTEPLTPSEVASIISLPKPFTSQSLARKVREVLNKDPLTSEKKRYQPWPQQK
jgi:PAS domain S-box-containing protein